MTSTPAVYDVCAIGNALVDIVAESTDAFLKERNVVKGGMTLADAERSAMLYDAIGPAVEVSGGSAANTVAGVASFGGKAAFMGKVKADQFGAIFRHDLHAQGVHFATPPITEDRRQIIRDTVPDRRTGAPTGRCIILVTPDAQRSMLTYLGAAVEFGPEDVQDDILRDSRVTYLEGYLFDPPEAKKAFHLAAQIVRDSGHTLALTLSDTFCVDRHRAEFMDLIRGKVDLLFANQNELLSLCQTDDLHTAMAMARGLGDNKIIVTTRSEKGAIIMSGQETVEVPAVKVDKVIDTTGAGDLFAAGFLFGLSREQSLADAGHLGAIAAAEVIGHYGPRPQQRLKDLMMVYNTKHD